MIDERTVGHMSMDKGGSEKLIQMNLSLRDLILNRVGVKHRHTFYTERIATSPRGHTKFGKIKFGT